MEQVDKQNRAEALGDILEALERFADAGGLETMRDKDVAFDMLSGLKRMALRHELSQLADAIEDFRKVNEI